MRKLVPVIAIAALLLSGCTSFLRSDQPVAGIYALRAAPDLTAIDGGKQVSRVVEIQRPILPPGFDTARIAMYLEGGRRLDYYSAAQWTAPLDETLQEFTTQTIRKTLSNVIIAEPGQSSGVEYLLQMRVNDFQPVYAGVANQTPQLIASISFTLVKMPEQKILTNFTIEQQDNVLSNNLGLITSGLERMLQSVEGKALETLSAHIK